MSILREIKIALFLSGAILSSYDVYAMPGDSEEETLSKGSKPVSSSSPPALMVLPKDVLEELSQRLLILNASEGRKSESSSSATVKGGSSIPKGVLDNISACLSPIGSLLHHFENPEKKHCEKKKTLKINGERDSFEISSPSTNMEIKSVEDFEKELPKNLRGINERLDALNRDKWTAKQKEDFRQLRASFNDVLKIYQEHNLDFQLIPLEKQRKHKQRQAAIAAIRSNGDNPSTLVMVLSSSEVSMKKGRVSGRPSKSSPPSFPLLRSTNGSSTPPQPLSMLLQFSKGSSSSHTPLLPSQQEGLSSPRPLPELPSEKNSSSSISSSPPLSPSATLQPLRSRSLSTPVKQVKSES